MKEPKQLNTAKEFGNQPQQQRRFYSVYGGGKYNCITTEIAHRTNSYGLPHVLTIYEL